MSTETEPKLYMYNAFASEGCCGGRSQIFSTKEEIPSKDLEKMSNNGEKIDWEFCGVITAGQNLYYDIYTLNGSTCCGGGFRYGSFYIGEKLNLKLKYKIQSDEDNQMNEDQDQSDDEEQDQEQSWVCYDSIVTASCYSYAEALEDYSEIIELSEIKNHDI